MRKAVQKAIYYLDTELVNIPVICFEYNTQEDFRNIVSHLHENIEVVVTFGEKDNFCYKVFNTIADLFPTLLLDKTTSVYIVNRKDVAIKLTKGDVNEKSRVAVIKIDSVLSEYVPTSYLPYLLYPVTFLLGGLAFSSFSFLQK